MLPWILNFFSGNLTRKTVLFVLIPLIFLSYFGTILFAIFQFPGIYDWRDSVISRLISPERNPEFHYLPSFGIAVTGVLMIPFAGYIGRRLRFVGSFGTVIGTFLFGTGVVCLILAGLVVSGSHRGPLGLASIHEICARAAALGIALGQLAFCSAALQRYLNSGPGKKRFPVRLLISWILLTLGPILGLAVGPCLWLCKYFRLPGSSQTEQALRGSLFWHLASWEWIGSVAVFLFLLSSALYLPE